MRVDQTNVAEKFTIEISGSIGADFFIQFVNPKWAEGDPIADMLTRIRNAVRVERPFVDMPISKVKRGLADVLKREGYIWDWQEDSGD